MMMVSGSFRSFLADDDSLCLQTKKYLIEKHLLLSNIYWLGIHSAAYQLIKKL